MLLCNRGGRSMHCRQLSAVEKKEIVRAFAGTVAM
jgi:hypothetical protein